MHESDVLGRDFFSTLLSNEDLLFLLPTVCEGLEARKRVGSRQQTDVISLDTALIYRVCQKLVHFLFGPETKVDVHTRAAIFLAHVLVNLLAECVVNPVDVNICAVDVGHHEGR